MDVKELCARILAETGRIIIGKDEVVRLVVMAALADGHVLLDDLPGVGKTTLVKTLSIVLGLESRRIQFVSDLLPSDITGMSIYNQKSGDFELRMGPVMTNILMADEINRAIPRTQSALLEAMEERQVTIDGQRFPLPEPFLVLATENPVEAESTFHLPAAQMDRFLISLSMGYPTHDDEVRMLETVGDHIPFDRIAPVTGRDEILEAQKACRAVYMSKGVAGYIVDICEATRRDERISMGASPRAAKALYQTAKVAAAMAGRDYVTPDDVQSIIHPVLDHRILLESGARFSGLKVDAVLDELISSVDASLDVKDLYGKEQTRG